MGLLKDILKALDLNQIWAMQTFPTVPALRGPVEGHRQETTEEARIKVLTGQLVLARKWYKEAMERAIAELPKEPDWAVV